jgi:hypothetical protein
MKRIIVLAAIISCTGCTVLRPIEGTSNELQQRLISGQLLKPGDRVEIVTTNQKAHRFTVTRIDAGLIEGKTESIQTDQVVSVERRQFSRLRTLALICGVVVVAGGVVAIVAAHTVPVFAL